MLLLQQGKIVLFGKKLKSQPKKIATLSKNLKKYTVRGKISKKCFKTNIKTIRHDNLFDIAHKDALTFITIKEDKEFLFAQRKKGRRESMGSIDTKLSKKEEESKDRQLQNELRKKKEILRLKKNTQTSKISE